MTKYCSKGKHWLALLNFGKDKNRTDGLKLYCKDCRNKDNRELRNANPDKYRLTNLTYSRTERAKLLQWSRSLSRKFWPHLTPANAVDEYNRILMSQNDNCGFCKKHKSEFKMRLAVDHCHITGTIRGLLCNKCNRFEVGRHTLQTAEAMVEYLKQYK